MWSAERGPAYGFDETCTLTVDDTLSKMRYWPRNRVLIPTFTDPVYALYLEGAFITSIEALRVGTRDICI